MALGRRVGAKFRSGLTILGIVIGITTVVYGGFLLTGLRQGIVDFFQDSGPITSSSREPAAIRAARRPSQGAQAQAIRPEYGRII